MRDFTPETVLLMTAGCAKSQIWLTALRKKDFEAFSNCFNYGDANCIDCGPEILQGNSCNMIQEANICSYSMILVETATCSDLISVSMTAFSADYNLGVAFDLCFVASSPLQQDQAEGVRMDIMWRPPPFA